MQNKKCRSLKSSAYCLLHKRFSNYRTDGNVLKNDIQHKRATQEKLNSSNAGWYTKNYA